jgi:hypothetical protein
VFAPEVVSQKLDRFEKEFGWRPVEHSIEEVDAWQKRLGEVFEVDRKGNITQVRGLTKAESRFIDNERAMCNPPEAPIWMGDYTFKPIGEIKIGDTVIGWEREVRPATNKQRYGNVSKNYERMKRATVVAVMRRISPIVKVTLESGRIIRCTPDHLWSNGATYRSEIPWINPKIGRTLRRVVDMYPNDPPDHRAAAWLGGIYDGEAYGVHITQSNAVNPEVYARIKSNLDTLGLEYAEKSGDNATKTKVYAKNGFRMHRRPDVFTLKGGVTGIAKFAAWCKPAKMRSIDRVALKNLSAKPDKIVRIEPDGEGEVVSMQTTTGNYVAWGYASKNCMASCHYFLTRYYYIKAKNRILRFSFRTGQWIVWQILCELDRLGQSKMLQILKARQLGISTLAEGIGVWVSQFVPGVAAQIGSGDGQKTQIMLGMMTLAIDQLPPWLPPTQTRNKVASDRALLEFARIGSMIMVQPGSMRGGMGQGATPTFVHLSEVSQYSNPVTQLDEGLFKSLHEGPELVVLLESTGDAHHPSSWWWKQQWIANRDNYWTGGADFLPVFLPWHTTPELYPGPWLKKHPMPADFQPNEDTISHVQRAQAYVRNTPMLAKVMGAEWTMPLEQQWYWQFKHEDHKRRRVEKSWYRQMPCDDYEALLGERDKIVDNQTIEVMKASQVEVEKVPVYMLAGDGVAEKHEPKEVDVWYGEDSPPRLKFVWDTPARTRLNWMLVPLKPFSIKTFDPLEKFLIFDEPEPGYDYSLGVDTGTGVGEDRSCVNVTRTGADAEPDVQVAEWASDRVSLDDVYIYMAAASAFYSKHMKDHPHPKICIEMKRKFGDRPYSLARFGLGFHRWHVWGQGFDRKTREDHNLGGLSRIGWYSNEWSRPMLLTAFFGAVENSWYKVRSKWLAGEIEEMEQKVTESGKTRADHARGEHDDRVFAAAMAYFTMHRHDLMVQREKLRYEEPSDGRILIETGPSKLSIVIPGDKWLNSKLAKDEKSRSRDVLAGL